MTFLVLLCALAQLAAANTFLPPQGWQWQPQIWQNPAIEYYSDEIDIPQDLIFDYEDFENSYEDEYENEDTSFQNNPEETQQFIEQGASDLNAIFTNVVLQIDQIEAARQNEANSFGGRQNSIFSALMNEIKQTRDVVKDKASFDNCMKVEEQHITGNVADVCLTNAENEWNAKLNNARWALHTESQNANEQYQNDASEINICLVNQQEFCNMQRFQMRNTIETVGASASSIVAAVQNAKEEYSLSAQMCLSQPTINNNDFSREAWDAFEYCASQEELFF